MRKHLINAAHESQHDPALIVLYQKTFSQPAVVCLDAVNAVAWLEGSVRRQHGPQQTLQIPVTGAVQRWRSARPLVTNLVASKTEACEQGFPSRRITSTQCNPLEILETFGLLLGLRLV